MRNCLWKLLLLVLMSLWMGDTACKGQWRLRYRPQPQPSRYYRPKVVAPAPTRYRPYPTRYRSVPTPNGSAGIPAGNPRRPVTKSSANATSSAKLNAKPAAAASTKRSDRSPKPGDIKYLKRELPPIKAFPRIAADYEPQRAILISVCELLPSHEKVFLQIVESCRGHIDVGVLVNDKKQLIDAVRVLTKRNQAFEHVKFYHLDLDTIWLRDFGPRIGQLETGSVAFDFLYEGTRPRDEKMPKHWAELTGQRYHAVPWTMQGGNLLFNGQGIALTTERIFDDNHIRFKNPLPGIDPEVERRDMVINEFRKECNLSQVVVLEPLRNEATRHVDMFAAFVAEDHVLVSQLNRGGDPVNAALLDRNAEKLKAIKLDDGRPMKVTRIPTPARVGKYWSTFTNVIFANDLVLLPAFNSDDDRFVKRAVAVYKTVFPDHKVVVIDTSSLRKLEGSVHCMSINIPQFADLPPRYLSFAKASQYVRKIDAKSNPGQRAPAASGPSPSDAASFDAGSLSQKIQIE